MGYSGVAPPKMDTVNLRYKQMRDASEFFEFRKAVFRAAEAGALDRGCRQSAVGEPTVGRTDGRRWHVEDAHVGFVGDRGGRGREDGRQFGWVPRPRVGQRVARPLRRRNRRGGGCDSALEDGTWIGARVGG